MKGYSSKSGLSLVEVILSLAVLSILSVFVLQMFLTSKTLNRESRELDLSVLMAENIMQQVRNFDSVDDLYNLSYLQDAQHTKKENEDVWTFAYDEKWRHAPNPKNSRYKVLFTSNSQSQTYGDVLIYHVKVVKIDDVSSSEERLLYEIEMQKQVF